MSGGMPQTRSPTISAGSSRPVSSVAGPCFNRAAMQRARTGHGEQCLVKHSLRRRPLKNFMKPFCIGLYGAM